MYIYICVCVCVCLYNSLNHEKSQAGLSGIFTMPVFVCIGHLKLVS